jgi:hypothetical protein
VVQSLERYRPDVLAKSGSGTGGNASDEEIICQKIGCRIVYGIGIGNLKANSSALIARFVSLRKDLVATNDRIGLTAP